MAIEYSVTMVPLILLWIAMHRSARMAAGARSLPALAVVLIPFVFFLVVRRATEPLLVPFVPQQTEATEASE
jgi:hypothetical protein